MAFAECCAGWLSGFLVYMYCICRINAPAEMNLSPDFWLVGLMKFQFKSFLIGYNLVACLPISQFWWYYQCCFAPVRSCFHRWMGSSEEHYVLRMKIKGGVYWFSNELKDICAKYNENTPVFVEENNVIARLVSVLTGCIAFMRSQNGQWQLSSSTSTSTWFSTPSP